MRWIAVFLLYVDTGKITIFCVFHHGGFSPGDITAPFFSPPFFSTEHFEPDSFRLTPIINRLSNNASAETSKSNPIYSHRRYDMALIIPFHRESSIRWLDDANPSIFDKLFIDSTAVRHQTCQYIYRRPLSYRYKVVYTI